MAADVTIKVHGLTELRRDLKAMERTLPRELTKMLREAIKPALPPARSGAPHRSGALAGSMRVGAAGSKAFLRSRLPYAAVIHWGGVVRPMGVPIRFKSRPFASEAIESKADEIVGKLGDEFDHFASRHGW